MCFRIILIIIDGEAEGLRRCEENGLHGFLGGISQMAVSLPEWLRGWT